MKKALNIGAVRESLRPGSPACRQWILSICFLHILLVWVVDSWSSRRVDPLPPWFLLDSAKWMGVAGILWVARIPSASPARLRWWLLSIGYVLGGIAVFLYGVRLYLPPVHTVSIGVPVLLYVLAAIPFLLAITSNFNRRQTKTLRRLAMMQAILLIVLFVTLVSSLVRFTGEIQVVNALLLNRVLFIQGLFLVICATLRILGATEEEDRRFFFLISVTMWIALLLSTIRNSMTLEKNAIFWDVELDFQSLVVLIMLMAVYNPPLWLRQFRPSKTLIHFSNVSISLLEGLVLVATGVSVARFHFIFGSIGIAFAVAIYGWRHGLIEASLEDAEQTLIAVNGELEGLAILDGLTAIPNRRAFELALERESTFASRSNFPIGIMMIDIDFFKMLNDACGHEEGDRCLKQVAGAMMLAIPRSRDFLARYGGEEFVALFPGINLSGLDGMAQRLSDAVRTLNLPHSMSPAGHVTVSIGAAVGTASDMNSLRFLLRVADENLYAAKRTGRDRSVCTEISYQLEEQSPSQVSAST